MYIDFVFTLPILLHLRRIYVVYLLRDNVQSCVILLMENSPDILMQSFLSKSIFNSFKFQWTLEPPEVIAA